MKFHVLLADVNPKHRDDMKLVLTKVGVEVVTTSNGNDTVKLAKNSRNEGMPFDVILMCMEMPGLDGHEAARNLRFSGYDRPIIAISEDPNSTDRQKAIDCGCDDLVSKSLDSKKLLALIHHRAMALTH